MFGYVRPSVRDLPEEELDRFRAMYCGLCHTLSRRYGQAARFILNYDFTYLAILLSDGTAGAQGPGWQTRSGWEPVGPTVEMRYFAMDLSGGEKGGFAAVSVERDGYR